MKKIIKLVFVLIGLWIILFSIDLVLSMNNKKPLIILKENSYNSMKEYISLGYKSVEYKINDVSTFKLHSLIHKTNDFKIIEPDNCTEGNKIFYEDKDYEYYFYCNKVVYVSVNGDEIEISKAIKNNIVSLDELTNLGLKFGKEAKNTYTLDTKESTDCSYLSGDKNQLQKVTDNIYYYCLDNAYMYVNSEYMELDQALKKYDFETIITGMVKKREYTSGAVMYNQDNSNILKCNNNKIIIGTKKLENFDFLCE